MQVSFFLCTFAPQNRTAATNCMKKCVFHIGFLVILMLCSSCVSHGVREAQEVVAQADSLWHDGQMYGIDAGDSATLAQAYETLDKSTAFCRRIRDIFPFVQHTSSLGTYSHACYHYGRLLREMDDPVAAMQVFINATHSHTDDYHILGRVYSNMGSICHLAGEFPLSYDMYERCADMYLQNGDTLLYYYGLNNMAVELVEQGRNDEALSILDNITCADEKLSEALLITRSEMYNLEDRKQTSAMYYTAILQINTQANTQGSVSQYKTIVPTPYDSIDKINRFYPIAEDIERYEEAVNILKTDLLRDRTKWLIYTAIGVLLLIFGIVLFLFINRKQKLQKVELDSLVKQQLDTITTAIKQHINTADLESTLHWKNYAAMKADTDLYMGGIVTKLEHYSLNETEIRFCILTMLDFQLKKIADTIHYSYPSGIKTLKKRISVKIGTEPSQMRDYLFQMATKEAL